MLHDLRLMAYMLRCTSLALLVSLLPTTASADIACPAYEAWMKDSFVPALRQDPARAIEVAKTNPCAQGGDDAYRVWYAAFASRWQPIASSYTNALRAVRSSPNAAAYAKALEAGKIPAAEQSTLAALLAAKPASAGARGYAGWMQAYGELVTTAYTGVGSTTQIFEPNSKINATEAALFDLLVRARPNTNEDAATTVWFPIFQAQLEKATDTVGGNEITADEDAFLARVRAARPEADGVKSYALWLQAYATAIDRAAARTGSGPATVMAELERVRPARGGEGSYMAWLGLFAKHLGNAAGSDRVFTDAEKSLLGKILGARPCGNAAADTAAYDRLRSRRDALGPAGAALVDQAAPTACAR